MPSIIGTGKIEDVILTDKATTSACWVLVCERQEDVIRWHTRTNVTGFAICNNLVNCMKMRIHDNTTPKSQAHALFTFRILQVGLLPALALQCSPCHPAD
jgi:hypothetical protein